MRAAALPRDERSRGRRDRQGDPALQFVHEEGDDAAGIPAARGHAAGSSAKGNDASVPGAGSTCPRRGHGMSLTATTVTRNAVPTPENPILIPIKPMPGEDGCRTQVSESTVELVIRAADEMEPLVFPSRLGDRFTAVEVQRMIDRKGAIIQAAFKASGCDHQVGLELATFGAFRFELKCKPLAPLIQALDDQVAGDGGWVKVVVSRAENARSGYYSGPRR
ncbi:MAG: hypothetical protein ACREGE_02820 [Candidatus Microsaccharimonas sp.]